MNRNTALLIGLALLIPFILVVACTWGEYAAYWEARQPPVAANQVVTDAVLGRSALVVARENEQFPRVLFQELPLSSGQGLRGQTVTLGAWLRAMRRYSSPTRSIRVAWVTVLPQSRARIDSMDLKSWVIPQPPKPPTRLRTLSHRNCTRPANSDIRDINVVARIAPKAIRMNHCPNPPQVRTTRCRS